MELQFPQEEFVSFVPLCLVAKVFPTIYLCVMQLFCKHYPGPGTPIIIMHGLFGMLDNWHMVARKLSESFDVYVPDLRNHGQSPHADEISYPLMAQDVHELMEQYSLQSAVLMGHSMGGKVAMEFALRYPEKTKKLIVADMAPVRYEPGHDQIFKALFAMDLSDPTKKRSDMDEAFAVMIPNFGIRQFLLKSLARDESGYHWKFNLEVLYKQYDHLLAGIDGGRQYDGETLFIRGGKSNYVLDEHEEIIRNLFPNNRIATVDGAGHWVHADKPAELIDLVEKFV